MRICPKKIPERPKAAFFEEKKVAKTASSMHNYKRFFALSSISTDASVKEEARRLWFG